MLKFSLQAHTSTRNSSLSHEQLGDEPSEKIADEFSNGGPYRHVSVYYGVGAARGNTPHLHDFSLNAPKPAGLSTLEVTAPFSSSTQVPSSQLATKFDRLRLRYTGQMGTADRILRLIRSLSPEHLSAANPAGTKAPQEISVVAKQDASDVLLAELVTLLAKTQAAAIVLEKSVDGTPWCNRAGLYESEEEPFMVDESLSTVKDDVLFVFASVFRLISVRDSEALLQDLHFRRVQFRRLNDTSHESSLFEAILSVRPSLSRCWSQRECMETARRYVQLHEAHGALEHYGTIVWRLRNDLAFAADDDNGDASAYVLLDGLIPWVCSNNSGGSTMIRCEKSFSLPVMAKKIASATPAAIERFYERTRTLDSKIASQFFKPGARRAAFEAGSNGVRVSHLDESRLPGPHPAGDPSSRMTVTLPQPVMLTAKDGLGGKVDVRKRTRFFFEEAAEAFAACGLLADIGLRRRTLELLLMHLLAITSDFICQPAIVKLANNNASQCNAAFFCKVKSVGADEGKRCLVVTTDLGTRTFGFLDLEQ